jgi:hypothetical protein
VLDIWRLLYVQSVLAGNSQFFHHAVGTGVPLERWTVHLTLTQTKSTALCFYGDSGSFCGSRILGAFAK